MKEKFFTYCSGACCPFTDCKRHPKHLKKLKRGTMVSIANLCGTCRRYIRFVVSEIMDEKQQRLR